MPIENYEDVSVYALDPDALAALRQQFTTGPSTVPPASLREFPFFGKLKSDPRFEEILKSAKPL